MIEWSFIGAISAFFLYLSSHMLKLANDGGLVGSLDVEFGEGMLNQIMPFGIVIIFLYFGFFVSLKSSAMGASTIIDFGKGKSTAAVRATGNFFKRQTFDRAMSSKTGKKVTKWAARTDMGMPGKGFKEKWASASGKKKALMAAGTLLSPLAYPARYATRKGGVAGLKYIAKESAAIDEKEKGFGKFGKDIESAGATYSSLGTDYQSKIALAQHLVNEKGGKGLAQLKEKELGETINLTRKYAPSKLKNLIKGKPELIKGQLGSDPSNLDTRIAGLVKTNMVPKEYDDDDVKKLIELGVNRAEAIEKAAFKKTVDSLKPSDIENLSTTLLDDSNFQEMVVRFKPSGFIRRIGEEKGLDAMEKLQNRAEEKDIGIKSITKTNPTFARAPYTTGGALMRKWKGFEKKEEIDKEIRWSQQSTQSFEQERQKIVDEISSIRREKERTSEQEGRLTDLKKEKGRIEQAIEQKRREELRTTTQEEKESGGEPVGRDINEEPEGRDINKKEPEGRDGPGLLPQGIW